MARLTRACGGAAVCLGRIRSLLRLPLRRRALVRQRVLLQHLRHLVVLLTELVLPQLPVQPARHLVERLAEVLEVLQRD